MPLAPKMTKSRFVKAAKPVTVEVPGADRPVELKPYLDATGCGWKGHAEVISDIDGQNQKVAVTIKLACKTSRAWAYS